MPVTTRHSYLLLSAFMYSLFFASAATMSLFSLWLGQSLALGSAQTGIIFSVNALAAICLQPLYGYLQDRLGSRQPLLWWVAGILVLTGPFFEFVYAPLLQFNLLPGAVAGALFLSAGIFAGMGVIESYVERRGRALGYEFGRLRMWGSLGWATATFFAGMLLNLDPDLNFWMASAAALGLMLLLVWMRSLPLDMVGNAARETTAATVDGVPAPVRLKDALALFALPRFWHFTLFVVGTFCITMVADQQFPVYFASLFATPALGNQMYGYLNAVQVVLEAIAMFIAPALVNRLGPKNSLLLAGALTAVRLVAFGLAEGPNMMACIRLFQSIDIALILVAVFKYLVRHFDNRLLSTLYLVGFQVCIQIGTAVYSPLAGMLYETIGFPRTFLLMGLLAGGITLLSARMLATDRNPPMQMATELSQ